jgi:hypothetical protein
MSIYCLQRPLPVIYSKDGFGIPLKFTPKTAKGIIKELADAALAPAWKKEMLAIVTKKHIHQDVVNFYCMGEISTGSGDKMKPFNPDPEEAKQDAKALTHEIQKKVDSKTVNILRVTSDYELAKSPFEFMDPDESEPFHKEYIDEVGMNWTWGLKYLFQRFSLRKVSPVRPNGTPINRVGVAATDRVDWRLWPFTQPPLNNRSIDVPAFLWNAKNTQHMGMIRSIFQKMGTGFDSQTAYSVPYTIQASDESQSEEYLVAMVEGTQSSVEKNDLVFQDLSASRCNLAQMGLCFKALYVSPLFFVP